ncbi:uncharacterized protein LOC144646465 [Oculina patagonica]
MAFKTGFLLLLLGIFGIFEVQAASIPTENDMWMDIDEDGDKRNVEVDNTDTARYLPTDDLTYEDLASDVADGFDYYKDAIESRAVACQDAFGGLCARLGQTGQCASRRHMRFAMKFCHGSCAQFCK